MDEKVWQAVLAAELSPIRSRALLRELGSLSSPTPQDVLARGGLAPAEALRVETADYEGVARALAAGVTLKKPWEYPEQLKAHELSPPAVFTWGEWSCLQRPCVAIVGTRGASVYGKAVAAKFAEAFARAGVTVVSGGALGIDAAAHKGALSAGGSTVAVLAGGIDKVYPAMHAGLFHQIRDSGCLVSQFAVGSRPNAYKFLYRNGLIASLSSAVVVVEAPMRSGALATAHRANDIGRQVFVVPANIDNLSFAGSHALIRDGATLVDHPDQVLEAIGITPVEAKVEFAAASEVGAKILSVLSGEPVATEVIVQKTGLETSDVLSELTMLELDGRVFRDAGGYALRL